MNYLRYEFRDPVEWSDRSRVIGVFGGNYISPMRSVCVRKLIARVPFLKNSKKAANVLNNLTGVFARKRLR